MISVSPNEHQLQQLQDILNDQSVPIAKRMRVIFTLKNLKSDSAIHILSTALADSSVLLAHEVAYCLGQTRNPKAVPFLISTLQNDLLHPMVRHEAAESLGAIGGNSAEQTLNLYKDHPIAEIRDTCLIALELIHWKKNHPSQIDDNASHPVFMSVDPAPPSSTVDPEQLRSTLLNHNFSLFQRYTALFALRNLGTPRAIEILSEALLDKDSGAVFTHEVAYVLGQLQEKTAVKALSDVLQNEELHCMVRHEAAEALGSIAQDETVSLLQKYSQDKEEAVKSSCVVALDILDYVQSDQFQYADALEDSSKNNNKK
jgi:deoxyhypusine monooxygenase